MGTIYSDKQRLDLPDAIILALQVVADAGEEYIDWNSGTVKGCVYVEGGSCSCIIARIYERAGVPVNLIATWDTAGSNGTSLQLDDLIAEDVLPLETDPKAAAFLIALQSAQDNGLEWGVALDGALDTVTLPDTGEHR